MARAICNAIRPGRTKNVRSWQKAGNGWAPSLLIALDGGLKRGLNDERPSLLDLFAQIEIAHEGKSDGLVDLTECLFVPGDVVVVHADPLANASVDVDGFSPFTLFRVSRRHPASRSSRRCHVHGHHLTQSHSGNDFDPHVFDGIGELTHVLFHELVQDGDTPMVIPRDSIDTTLRHGALAFELDPYFVEDITDALEADGAARFLAHFVEEEELPFDGHDSEGLHADQLRRQQEAQAHFTGQLARSMRDRAPQTTPADLSRISFFYQHLHPDARAAAAAKAPARGRGRGGASTRGRGQGGASARGGARGGASARGGARGGASARGGRGKRNAPASAAAPKKPKKKRR
jgi:hypothetical protein